MTQTPNLISSVPLKTVVLNGSLHKPSRTQVLLEAVNHSLAAQLPLETRFIELSDLVPHIGTALSTASLHADAKAAIDAIETADLLIVGSPVFRGSIPGLFKHLFDLIGMESLVGKPVLLAATGGSQRHSLVIDHQLRPLFSFFQALTLPIGVYGTQQEIEGGRVTDEVLRARIELTVQLALPVLRDIAVRKHATHGKVAAERRVAESVA